MEGWRRQRWDNNNSNNNNRRSQNKKPPRGCWQPTVPSWEKEFCKVVGSMEWETLLQMKKFTHLYGNVIKWNDSAGEEAFRNAKKRFWAKINGFPCHISLPDPDLYIDKINWDSETDPDPLQDREPKPVIPNTGEHHEPVVIFGDSLVSNQAFSPVGWGDNEEIPANYGNAAWEQNRNQGYSSNTWQFGGPAQYMSWGGSGGSGGLNNGWGWGYPNAHFNYVGPDTGDTSVAGARYQANEHYGTRVPRNEGTRHRAPYWGKQSVAVERRSTAVGSCGPVGRQGAATVGQTWNQDKPVS